jgi:hypothetical protein
MLKGQKTATPQDATPEHRRDERVATPQNLDEIARMLEHVRRRALGLPTPLFGHLTDAELGERLSLAREHLLRSSHPDYIAEWVRRRGARATLGAELANVRREAAWFAGLELIAGLRTVDRAGLSADEHTRLLGLLAALPSLGVTEMARLMALGSSEVFAWDEYLGLLSTSWPGWDHTAEGAYTWDEAVCASGGALSRGGNDFGTAG